MNVPESFLSCIFLQCIDHRRCFFFFFRGGVKSFKFSIAGISEASFCANAYTSWQVFVSMIWASAHGLPGKALWRARNKLCSEPVHENSLSVLIRLPTPNSVKGVWFSGCAWSSKISSGLESLLTFCLKSNLRSKTVYKSENGILIKIYRFTVE